jgi:hypothetical protein
MWNKLYTNKQYSNKQVHPRPQQRPPPAPKREIDTISESCSATTRSIAQTISNDSVSVITQTIILNTQIKFLQHTINS